jgi:hypothetical protein
MQKALHIELSVTFTGVGKSVLLASVTNQLETELAGDEEWTLQYLSCETLQNSTGKKRFKAKQRASTKHLDSQSVRVRQ